MPASDKLLSQMTATEIAQLTPEQFKTLALEHNDRIDSNETEYQAVIDTAKRMQNHQLEQVRASFDGLENLGIGEERTLSAVSDEQTRRYVKDRDTAQDRAAKLTDAELTKEHRELSTQLGDDGLTDWETHRLYAVSREQVLRQAHKEQDRERTPYDDDPRW